MLAKSLRFSQIVSLLSVLVLVMAEKSISQDKKEASSIAPTTYIEQTLDIMQKNALNKTSINWTQVRQETLARAKRAKTTIDTYPAIVYALTQLQESHSFLQLPDDMPAQQKEMIQAEMAKVRPKLLPTKDSPFSPSIEMQGHIDRQSGRSFAHVVVPLCVGRYADPEKDGPEFQQFADKLHEIVLTLEAQKPVGWLVDLRGNQGGNIWPMLAGIGAVLGEGDLGAFESPDGSRTFWFYRAGKAGTRTEQGEDIAAEVKHPPFIFDDLPWVAVLVDRATGSSGEAVAISFAGRAREHSFGEHTAGLTTATEPHPLPDGAVLVLCEALEADRTGKRYPDGLDPDSVVASPATRPTEEKDPVLQAAKDWLTLQVATAH
jgi:carboxyl-terminal processing protease